MGVGFVLFFILGHFFWVISEMDFVTWGYLGPRRPQRKDLWRFSPKGPSGPEMAWMSVLTRQWPIRAESVGRWSGWQYLDLPCLPPKPGSLPPRFRGSHPPHSVGRPPTPPPPSMCLRAGPTALASLLSASSRSPGFASLFSPLEPSALGVPAAVAALVAIL